MILSEYTEKLVLGKSDPLNVWTGPEAKLMDLYIQNISDMYNLEVKRVDTVQEIMTKIQSKNMLGGKGKLYVIRDDNDVWDVENFLTKMNMLLINDRVILIYTNMDKRKKFAKESDPVEFEHLDEDVLVGYVAQEIQMSDKNSRRLIQMCERDYSRILLECDKIRQYAHSQNISHESAFIDLSNRDMIYAPVGDIIFQMTDSVVTGSRKEAYRLLYQLYQKGEPPIKVLSILYTNFRNLLMVQGVSEGDTVNKTGLTPWQVKLAKEKKGIWSQSRIKQILRALQDCESGIKNGKYDDRTAIEVALIEILG